MGRSPPLSKPGTPIERSIISKPALISLIRFSFPVPLYAPVLASTNLLAPSSILGPDNTMSEGTTSSLR